MTTINDIVRTKHAGSDWIKSNLAIVKPGTVISPLGEIAADILGQMYFGIYHLKSSHLFKVDWSNNRTIEITITDTDLATFDSSTLTIMVILAAALKIRISIKAATHGYITFTFLDEPDHRSIDDAMGKYLNNYREFKVNE